MEFTADIKKGKLTRIIRKKLFIWRCYYAIIPLYADSKKNISLFEPEATGGRNTVLAESTFTGKYAFLDQNKATSSANLQEKEFVRHNLSNLVDLYGKPISINKREEMLQILCTGIYVDEQAKQIPCTYLYNANEGTFFIGTLKMRVPLKDVYVAVKSTGYLLDIKDITFRELSSIHERLSTVNYQGFENGTELARLESTILNLNAKFSIQFSSLLKTSEDILLDFAETGLAPKLEIQCPDGVSVFYPPTVPIFAGLEQSLFSVPTWNVKILTVSYGAVFVKKLLRIYLTPNLPSPRQLILDPSFVQDSLTIFAKLSDYFGFDFYACYFTALVESEAYQDMF